MSGKDKILVVVETEIDPKAIVDRATWVAKLLDCELELWLCDPSVSVLGDGFFVSNEAKEIAHKIRQAHKDMIEELAEEARKQGVSVTTDVLHERPVADAVLARALDIEPRFVMKGTHYHTVAERAIMVDADWQLIRSCPFPLWLVKAGAYQEKPYIIAAVDPTHEHDKPAALDQAIVDEAKVISDAAGGELHLLHTYELLVGIGAEVNKTLKSMKLPVDEIDERMQKEHRQALKAFADKLGFDDKHVHQLPGRTREVLPTFARENDADLVVMGALARWGIKRMVIGSTTERVLDHLPCDVLVVRAR
jgi:universal stress protein E